MRKWIRRTVVAAVVLGGIGTAVAWYLRRDAGPGVSFETARVARCSVVVSIAASGTLEPEEVVDVGAQISGRILSFGRDVEGKAVDYGSVVAEGAVVAKIDDSLYQADAAQAEAQVKSAEAGVERAQADLGQMKAKQVQATRDWDRARKLEGSEALSRTAYDAYESASKTADANVAVGVAAIRQAEAALAQARTSLWRAQRNLEYCTIASPVKGTVIDRRVSIGQTVAAGLSTPSLFLIARDLKRMQVWVSVNEADIARVYPGQPVTFTVDALPDETFRGAVFRIRPNASMTQNVVTFTVEIATDNSAGRLRPYLTANVRFEVSRRDNVLVVPSGALSWTPTADQVAAEDRQGAADSRPEGPPPPAPPAPGSRPSTRPAGAAPAGMTPAVLWVARGRYVHPVPVLSGLSDGTNVEVAGPGLREDMDVVTGVAEGGAQGEAGNPFMPRPPKGFKPPAGGPPPM